MPDFHRPHHSSEAPQGAVSPNPSCSHSPAHFEPDSFAASRGEPPLLPQAPEATQGLGKPKQVQAIFSPLIDPLKTKGTEVLAHSLKLSPLYLKNYHVAGNQACFHQTSPMLPVLKFYISITATGKVIGLLVDDGRKAFLGEMPGHFGRSLQAELRGGLLPGRHGPGDLRVELLPRGHAEGLRGRRGHGDGRRLGAVLPVPTGHFLGI